MIFLIDVNCVTSDLERHFTSFIRQYNIELMHDDFILCIFILQTGANLFLHYGDLSDSTNLFHIISEIKPHEIYNLGAMSHVAVSYLLFYIYIFYIYTCVRHF